jgi:hypothetical protein
MNPDKLEHSSLAELLAMLPQGGYSFRTGSGGWIHGVVEQTWDDDPESIDREDLLIFLRRHLNFLQGQRESNDDGDDCVVIDSAAEA